MDADAGGPLDDAGADLEQAFPEGRELGPGERHPVGHGIAQGEHQPVGRGVQDEAELIGERALAGGPVGGELALVLPLTAATQSAEEMFRAAEPLLAREADGRAFRLIGIGAHDLVDAARFVQGDLFGGAAPNEDKIGDALDTVREKFGDDAIVRGRGFGKTLVRQGPSRLD